MSENEEEREPKGRYGSSVYKCATFWNTWAAVSRRVEEVTQEMERACLLTGLRDAVLTQTNANQFAIM